MIDDFVLPGGLEAHAPPEARGLARDGVRLLVGRRAARSVEHRAFADLPDLLDPGDLLVVNVSPTLPAAVRTDRLVIHFSTEAPEGGGHWLVELRCRRGTSSVPYSGCAPGEWIPLPGDATLTLVQRRTPRLWEARLSTAVVPYLREHGVPIKYPYVREDWPLAAYQTAFAVDRGAGSAEMPSAARAFTPELVTRLVSRGVLIAPLTLHTGVASPEAHEPPYAERYDVPAATAALVGHVRGAGGRVVAVGTTVVRALETAAARDGRVRAGSGWTEHLVTPGTGVRAVDGLLTGLHEPASSHLQMLRALAGTDLLDAVYDAALTGRYLWHEFGDANLLLP
ncbi:S-adenosylmethionine:tRNA ribosyltransferase-isomerase [Actinomadura atramentaria]|uniref:S-adenosylmethionine:tRNA ribosyltransferase-isomerase n=1 Tax=Actinomadura atramentaria TaxID=1990 RepID=UPI00036DBDE0|nr:S-adenosylmethionine:tRNA ribosyltransferase-isomerase [Actinomadura atramentaria]